MKVLLVLISIVFVSCSPSMQDIHDQVANDALKGYELSKKAGDKVEICVKAGLVAESYNQAHDEKNYLSWKQTEKDDCAQAGIQK